MNQAWNDSQICKRHKVKLFSTGVESPWSHNSEIARDCKKKFAQNKPIILARSHHKRQPAVN